MNQGEKLRKILIVVEETGEKDAKGDDKFIVYLDGDKERIGRTDIDHLSAAEFWGLKLFQICGEAIRKSGALESATDKGRRH